MLKNVTLCVFCVFFISGCIFTREPYKSTRYFDIGLPLVAKEVNAKVGIRSFSMSCPTKYSMTYRISENEIYRDEYNKWVQFPDKMLANYLKMYFSAVPPEKAPEFEISGRILAFEANLEKSEALLVVDCMITRKSGNESIETSHCKSFTVGMKDKTPDSFASAMSKAVAEFAEDLAKNLK